MILSSAAIDAGKQTFNDSTAANDADSTSSIKYAVQQGASRLGSNMPS